MKKIISLVLVLLIFSFSLGGCFKSTKDVKIGVAFGVGAAVRWGHERQYMIDYAASLNVELIAPPLNTNELEKSLFQDCKELIDAGIDVLILTPRDVNNVSEILNYARKNKVKVVDYARAILNESVDIYVGYDSKKIGQTMGKYLVEEVYEGDYLILKGDPQDNNAKLLYEGAIMSIEKSPKVNIVQTEDVISWSPQNAKEILKQCLKNNNNSIDAIFAPNDAIAGACAEVLEEANITGVKITGMDAELNAIRRIVRDKQDMTIFMDLQNLAQTAVLQAVKLATGEKLDINSQFSNGLDSTINAQLINGQLITKENIERLIINKGIYSYDDIYSD